MLCSECSRHVRPIVVIDIDGTIAEYHVALSHFSWRYWNKKPRLSMWTGLGEFEDWLGLTKEEYRQAKLAFRQGGHKRWMEMYPGTVELFNACREAGAEIWVCTTRPWQRLDNVDPDTREWLRRNGLECDGLLYGDDKYQRLVEAVDRDRIVAVIDDLPEQVDIARSLMLPVIMRENLHNSAPSERRVPRGNLSVCRDWSLDQIEQWEKKHAAV